MLVDRSLNRALEEVSGSLEENTNAPTEPELDLIVDPGQVAAFKEERRAHYGKREKKGNPSSSRKGKSRTDLEVGSPMYDFINMHASIKCQRIVPEVYFGNDQTREFQFFTLYTMHDIDSMSLTTQSAHNDHLLCESTTPFGCIRCAPKNCAICCDLCNPEFFEQYCIPLTKQTRIPAKSRTKTFEMTATSNNLKAAIFDW